MSKALVLIQGTKTEVKTLLKKFIPLELHTELFGGKYHIVGDEHTEVFLFSDGKAAIVQVYTEDKIDDEQA